MKTSAGTYIQLNLKQGRLCPCGQRAVRHTNAGWTCAECIVKDNAINGSDRIRGTCGFPGPPQPYSVRL